MFSNPIYTYIETDVDICSYRKPKKLVVSRNIIFQSWNSNWCFTKFLRYFSEIILLEILSLTQKEARFLIYQWKYLKKERNSQNFLNYSMKSQKQTEPHLFWMAKKHFIYKITPPIYQWINPKCNAVLC